MGAAKPTHAPVPGTHPLALATERARFHEVSVCCASCRANRLRRSHRRQPQVQPARIARPSRSAVRKAPGVAAEWPRRRRWHGVQHLGWEGSCGGQLRSRIRHWLCCCVSDRYAAKREPSRIHHPALACTPRRRHAPHWRDPEPPACLELDAPRLTPGAFPHPERVQIGRLLSGWHKQEEQNQEKRKSAPRSPPRTLTLPQVVAFVGSHARWFTKACGGAHAV